LFRQNYKQRKSERISLFEVLIVMMIKMIKMKMVLMKTNCKEICSGKRRLYFGSNRICGLKNCIDRKIT
jgi:hypothetical protein